MVRDLVFRENNIWELSYEVQDNLYVLFSLNRLEEVIFILIQSLVGEEVSFIPLFLLSLSLSFASCLSSPLTLVFFFISLSYLSYFLMVAL